MKVLAVVPHYPPDSRVGAWLATHEYMRDLVTRGHEVTVYRYLALHRGVVDVDGVKVEGHSDGHFRARQLADGSDVVVSHCGDGGLGCEVAAVSGRPSIRFAHGTRPLEFGDADLVVFNSHHLAASSGWEGRHIVCHPPVHAASYRTTPGDRVTLVNLSDAKGGGLFWRLARAMPDTRFLGVRGGYGVQIHERRPNVQTQPATDDMRGVYGRTRILLMPSKHETWGMVGVEAMASGIPVIAHPTPGLRESLGDAGIFVDRDDPHEWIAQIRRLGDPAEWAAASAKAVARSSELDPQPDLDRFAAALEETVCLT